MGGHQGEAQIALWLGMNLTLGPFYLLDPSDAILQGRAGKIHIHTGDKDALRRPGWH